MKNFAVHRFLWALLFAVSCVYVVHGQATTGSIRGVVSDQNGAVISGAKVTLTRKSTGGTQTAETNGSGQFEFTNLQPADDYSVSVEAQNFKNIALTDVRVSVNQNTDLPVQLSPGALTETVTITAGGAELVDTTSANLSKAFSSRQVVELAQTTAGPAGSPAGVNNLALLAPNVTSSGGVGVGTGGSVGGQRPRNNNFIVDGVDNNDKSITGPQSYISPEEVAEFTLLQNQFSAEFARSNGGNFLTVTKSGTNDFHGTGYGFFRNRYLNALDTIQKNAGVTRDKSSGDLFMPRSDYFRGGFNIGGPLYLPHFGEGGPSVISGKDKLYFFTSYERVQTGSAASAGGIVTPTAAGFAALNTIPGLSGNNLAVFNSFVPVAPVNDQGTINVLGRPIPVGNVSFAAPNFFKQNHAVINLDYLQSSATQHHVRFTFTNGADIDNTPNLPVFFTALPSKQRLFSYTLIHNFSANLINETRLAFRRSSQNFPVPGITFPGLTVFPNITLDDLGLNIGPDPNAPQFGIENNYQIVDNLTMLKGKHTFKFGGDLRWIISPQSFSQRVRGDYEYLSTEQFLVDLSPDAFGERNAGNSIYYGNQKVLYAFAQDDWRIRPNLTLNLGVSYSYQQVPQGARTSQVLNAISTVPGLLEFREPKAQTKNFAPKFGFAWSPDYKEGLLGRIFGSGGKSSLRAGFSLGYDYIFDNLYILSNPPQLQQTNDVDTTLPPTSNFLAAGGLPDTPVAITDPVVARQNTGAFIPDQEVPYSLTWTGSYQRQFGNDWSMELRYVGTRGIHLLEQNRINRQAKVAPEDGRPGLPTFFTAPSQATLDGLALDLDQINARSSFVPQFENAGFDGASVVAFLSNGNSTYHGGSVQVTKRFTRGFQMTSAYTFSHLIDDTTAEVFSTVLSPRRVEDFQNLRRERADSALDHRHRFVTSWIYEVPWFSKSTGFKKTLLSGFNLAGTYTYEAGERVTVRSGNDANLNGDNAGDRAILNPNGIEGVGSEVTPLCRISACTFDDDGNVIGTVVGYLANNPNARYIQTGDGAQSNIGRNTFLLPAINNVDFSIFKNFRIGESRFIQIRADFFNVLNHPQYVPGSVNSVDPVATTGLTTLNQVTPLTLDFLNPSAVLSSNPRVIQLAARFNF
ncbi:MAG TPA: carboxypeptidase regulatory-like domain-containing protein [Pyrinomonadaceae bacterium]|nr:carboxypeptidase regulatory-like domain-containing protein [Pyrinomonadaceae bacterium]